MSTFKLRLLSEKRGRISFIFHLYFSSMCIIYIVFFQSEWVHSKITRLSLVIQISYYLSNIPKYTYQILVIHGLSKFIQFSINNNEMINHGLKQKAFMKTLDGNISLFCILSVWYAHLPLKTINYDVEVFVNNFWSTRTKYIIGCQESF